jgi:SAM-dependent methyltransferase
MDASVASHIGSFYQDVAAFQALAASVEPALGREHGADEPYALFACGLQTLMSSADELEQHLAARDASLLADTRGTFRKLTGSLFRQSPIIERALTKPRGYAGDHALLDMYYTDQRAPGGFGWALDDLTQRTPAVRAVVNRKDYVKKWLEARVAKRSCAKVIDLACGPCRLERELFDAGRAADAHLVVVDHDAEALAYARRVLGPYAEHVEFVEGNAIQMARTRSVPRCMAQASLVVSLGLFDYLPRGIAVSLLRALRLSAAPGAELLVGNFAQGNPTRPFMEWAADWVLIYRSDEEFLQLFLDAGFAPDAITCERESEHGLVLMVTARV